MQIGRLVKLARHVGSLDEALEVLAIIGVECDVTPLWKSAGSVAADPGAVSAVALHELLGELGQVRGIYRLDADVKGVKLHALVVVPDPDPAVLARARAEMAATDVEGHNGRDT